MKKHVVMLALLAMQQLTIAQTINVHFKNGQVIEYPSDNVDYVDFSAKPSAPTVTAGQAIDLGLSVYWASCNLGAEKPEEYGDYYAWGETKTKSKYSQDNYSYYDVNTLQYIDIGENISGTQYDAATVNLGADWRMPTKDEIEELIKNCTWEWTQIDNINGYKVIGKNGNSIFLPAAGFVGVNGYVAWSNNVQYITGTRYNLFGKIYFLIAKLGYNTRVGTDVPYYGNPIRPVTSNINAGGNPIDHSQDYLVTEKVKASFTGGAYTQINNRIQVGSVLNTKFTNGSSVAVALVSVQIFESGSSNAGNNMLESETEIAAGESKAYGLRLGTSMAKPVVRFTYRYNKKKYTAEATWNF